MRASKPITVTLGDQRDDIERRVSSGQYASASEVMRAALRALDREERMLDDLVATQVRQALEDTRPSVPARAAFARIEERHAAQSNQRAGDDGA
ncbi:type II toxin-antitoxin system ParD family antitoxin [Rhizobium sp. CG5]|uniref:ribbon-helix-helix domain-containing protein n=1 Tax=Rhizobium sp. CG5 TaxID=2726076 RepID=UPI0020349069|nr:type II toxin-antitoxin system ParD family antitoxin [Rhizobium sp. CG5]MCM2473868.1 type II toxin-antitoxin system ParD family antitoxin [Rhizobium sp. CG5]